MRKLLALLLVVAAAPSLADQQKPKGQAEAYAAIQVKRDVIRADPSQAGCLGRDAATCLASLVRTIYIAPDPLIGGLRLPTPVEHDINGDPVGQSMDFLVTFTPKPGPGIMTHLMLADGEHVSSINFALDSSPLLARTQADWDATHVFEITTAVLGPECVGTDRLAFYRRYDVAQRKTSSRDNFGGGYSDPTVSSSISGDMTICGAKIDLIAVSGISAETGSFAGSSIMFRPAP